jgi:hypothetical protein
MSCQINVRPEHLTLSWTAVIECIEGNQALSVRMCDMNATLLHTAQIKGLGIDELHNQDAKKILVSQILGQQDLGQTAEQFAGQAAEQLAQRRSLRNRRMIGCKQFE